MEQAIRREQIEARNMVLHRNLQCNTDRWEVIFPFSV
jgi:hypothetical protein